MRFSVTQFDYYQFFCGKIRKMALLLLKILSAGEPVKRLTLANILYTHQELNSFQY